MTRKEWTIIYLLSEKDDNYLTAALISLSLTGNYATPRPGTGVNRAKNGKVHGFVTLDTEDKQATFCEYCVNKTLQEMIEECVCCVFNYK